MRGLKRVGKFFLGVLTGLFTLGLIVGAVFGVKGYLMSREALEQLPVEEMAEEIQADEHFTTIEELPELYVQAVIAAEDQRFWTHGGYDLIAIGRALWNDLRTLSFAEGGSTSPSSWRKTSILRRRSGLNEREPKSSQPSRSKPRLPRKRFLSFM